MSALTAHILTLPVSGSSGPQPGGDTVASAGSEGLFAALLANPKMTTDPAQQPGPELLAGDSNIPGAGSTETALPIVPANSGLSETEILAQSGIVGASAGTGPTATNLQAVGEAVIRGSKIPETVILSDIIATTTGPDRQPGLAAQNVSQSGAQITENSIPKQTIVPQAQPGIPDQTAAQERTTQHPAGTQAPEATNASGLRSSSSKSEEAHSLVTRFDTPEQGSRSAQSGNITQVTPDPANRQSGSHASTGNKFSLATGAATFDRPDAIANNNGGQITGIVLTRETIATENYTQQMRLADENIRIPAKNLAVEISRQAQTGLNRFEIRMDPPELGRIDVRLEMKDNGNVTARLVVERPETLDLLQRDARLIERTLSDNGLKTEEGGIRMSLKNDGNGQQTQNGANGSHDQSNQSNQTSHPENALLARNEDFDDIPLSIHHINVDGGLDIRV